MSYGGRLGADVPKSAILSSTFGADVPKSAIPSSTFGPLGVRSRRSARRQIRTRIRRFSGSAVAPKRVRNDLETISKPPRNYLGSGAGKMYNSEEIDDFASTKRPTRRAGLDPPVFV